MIMMLLDFWSEILDVILVIGIVLIVVAVFAVGYSLIKAKREQNKAAAPQEKKKKTYEKGVSREYKFWDKYLTKHEQSSSVDPWKLLPRKQIERSRKKLTEEQLTELLNRYDNLKK